MCQLFSCAFHSHLTAKITIIRITKKIFPCILSPLFSHVPVFSYRLDWQWKISPWVIHAAGASQGPLTYFPHFPFPLFRNRRRPARKNRSQKSASDTGDPGQRALFRRFPHPRFTWQEGRAPPPETEMNIYTLRTRCVTFTCSAIHNVSIWNACSSGKKTVFFGPRELYTRGPWRAAPCHVRTRSDTTVLWSKRASCLTLSNMAKKTFWLALWHSNSPLTL